MAPGKRGKHKVLRETSYEAPLKKGTNSAGIVSLSSSSSL